MASHNHKPFGCAALLVLLLFGVSNAEGQQVAVPFDQLRSRVAVGDKVTITDTMGRQARGTIARLSSSSLTLTVGVRQTEFFEADVERISQRDSRWNGTLWGLGVGAGLGALLDRGLVKEYGREDIGIGESFGFIATAAGVGAGIGFVVDALIKGQRVVYSRSGTLTQTNLTVFPIWATRRQGIAVLLTF